MIDIQKHRDNLANGTEGDWSYSEKENGFEIFDIRRHLIARVETKEDAELICKLHNDAAELLNDSEELQKIRKLSGDALSVGRTLGEQRDQYRRGITVLDKLLHDTGGIDMSEWNKILDGMTLHDYLWEAGQPDKDKEVDPG